MPKACSIRRTFRRLSEFGSNRGDSSRETAYERYPTSPSKTLRAEMGFSFQLANCGEHIEECRNKSHTDSTKGSPRRAAEAKEKPAGLRRRAFNRWSRGMSYEVRD
jgi:hypothetical protein